jgi:hypothetical protein
MAKLLPIDEVSLSQVQGVIKQALRPGVDADVLEDFLASVDWSGADRSRPAIADDLGQLEGWNRQYSDGELTMAEYVGRLLSRLPEDERHKHLFLDGGTISITVVCQEDFLAQPKLDRFADPPRMGSRILDRRVRDVPESDIGLRQLASAAPAQPR